MVGFRPLPWDYGVRNLFRRPGRSALTLVGLALVVLLIFVVVGFVRGLEESLAASGDPQAIFVHSQGAGENVENSSVPARTASLVAASFSGVARQPGPGGTTIPAVSPELYLGTLVGVGEGDEGALGLVRGVTPSVLLVRRSVQLIEGRWPGPGEAIVGRMAAAKLGRETTDLAVGKTMTFEGRVWTISGRFASAGSTHEAETWCRLEDLQPAMKRQDLSLVAFRLASGATPADADEFFKERLDLELQATPEMAYYAALSRHYGPVRMLAWAIVAMVASAGVFAGLNTMYGAVAGRVRELAMLQSLGFLRRAIVLSLIQEGALLSAAASLVAAVVAIGFVNGVAVRFTMGAFALRMDGTTVLVACGTGLFVGVVGSIPPALRALRLPLAEGLRAA